MSYRYLFIKFIFILSLFTSLTSCFFSSSQQENQEEDTVQQEDSKNEMKSVNNSKMNDELPHPRTSSEWDLNLFIVGNNRPPANEINECIKELLVLTKDATNDFSLIESKNKFTENVEDKSEFYHWCFYSMLHALDLKLDEETMGLEKRKNIFFKNMRGLWLLSQTLDESREVQIYFSFLRSRYLDMSKKYFGRDLEIVNQPFSGYKTQIEKASTEKKPAGAVEEDDE